MRDLVLYGSGSSWPSPRVPRGFEAAAPGALAAQAIPFGDGAVDPKILDHALPGPHVSSRKEEANMKDFWKKLLVQQPGQGASATLPELDGMP